MPKPPAHCPFCDLIRGAAEVSVCYEDSDAIAFMDIQPVNDGHVLVVPRTHYERIEDLPRDVGLHLYEVATRLMPVIQQVSGCHDMNVVVNSGSAAGQDVFHFHLHLIPVPQGKPFPLQLPDPGAPVPSRSELDVMAARIGRCLHEEEAPLLAHT